MSRRAKINSSKACRKRLEELFQPIEAKLENGEFDVEGGSDAYDEAINSVKEAYFATPDLGPMIKDQWDIFLKENTDRPVEMIDLDELDDVDQPTDQEPHLNDQAPQVTDADGAWSDIVPQTPSAGDMEDDLLQRVPNPNDRAEFAKKFKAANMDKKREKSRAACKARLDELFELINQKLDTDVYDGEEGYTLYLMDKAEAIGAYQCTPDLGLMKSITLDDYLDAIHHCERPIERMDEYAELGAKKYQATIIKLLTEVMEQFKAFRKLFQAWLSNRSANINWLTLEAGSLNEGQKISNTVVVASSIGGIGMGSAVVPPPATFGGSLTICLRVVGVGAEVTNFVTHKIKKDEALTRLKKDKEQTDEMISVINKLSQVGDDLDSIIGVRIDLQFSTDEVVAAAKLSADASKALGEISVRFADVSFAMDAHTLIKTIKDMKDGSKSKLATGLREIAGKLEQQVTDVVSISRGIEVMVIETEGVLTPLLKKYPLTIGRCDNE